MLNKNFRLSYLVAAMAAMTFASAPVMAAPQVQSCAPMEISYNGASGIAYLLDCKAGSWNLSYTGAVPSGLSKVLAQYKLSALNKGNGANFTMNRTIHLPSPAYLGQGLLREAVLLDNGDIALRDCESPGCTLYRPLGAEGSTPAEVPNKIVPQVKSLTPATITVTPQIAQLTKERDELALKLSSTQHALIEQGERLTITAAQLEGAQKETSRVLEQIKSTPNPMLSVAASPLPVVDPTAPAFQPLIANAGPDGSMSMKREFEKEVTRVQARLTIKHNLAMTEISKKNKALQAELDVLKTAEPVKNNLLNQKNSTIEIQLNESNARAALFEGKFQDVQRVLELVAKDIKLSSEYRAALENLASEHNKQVKAALDAGNGNSLKEVLKEIQITDALFKRDSPAPIVDKSLHTRN